MSCLNHEFLFVEGDFFLQTTILKHDWTTIFGDFFKHFFQPPNKQIQVKDMQKHDMVVSFSLVPMGSG